MKRPFTETMRFHFSSYMAGEGVNWSLAQKRALLILETHCLDEDLNDWEFEFCNRIFPPR